MKAHVFSEVTPQGERYWVYEIRDGGPIRSMGVRHTWRDAMHAVDDWGSPSGLAAWPVPSRDNRTDGLDPLSSLTDEQYQNLYNALADMDRKRHRSQT